MTSPVAELAAQAGILPRFGDLSGQDQVAGRETQLALLRAMGLEVSDDRQASERLAALRAGAGARALPEWLVIAPDRPSRLPGGDAGAWTLTLEQGDQIEGRGAQLPPMPMGLHRISAAAARCTLLAAPPRLPLPARGWGVTAPLWGLNGPDRAGFGDYHDLRRAGEALAGHGAAFLGINPIHAGFATDPDFASPYSPSHRRRLNPLHIATGDGVATGAYVDYRVEVPAKRAALRAAYDSFCAQGDAGGFEVFLAREGAALHRFGAHQALSDRHGPRWTDWPTALRDAETAPLDGLERDIRYHAWLQYTAHRQLSQAQDALTRAGMRYGLYLDLAVGTHPAGAETWADGGWFARGVSLGAPPDPFAPQGQTWNLAPLNPRALIAGGFAILAETLRHLFTYARLVRIDHILGFERAFWMPGEADLPGAYVKMPREAMLAVLRIEATRAGASVIGEDLGVVPAGLQEALGEAGILGCRLLQFELGQRGRDGHAGIPTASLASFGTHDLPTWRGWRAGADIATRAELGLLDAPGAAHAQAERAASVSRFDAVAGGESAEAMHASLARTRAALVAVQAEDLLDVAEQSNLPGTVEQYPNWRHKLPLGAAALADDPRLARTAAAMKSEGR